MAYLLLIVQSLAWRHRVKRMRKMQRKMVNRTWCKKINDLDFPNLVDHLCNSFETFFIGLEILAQVHAVYNFGKSIFDCIMTLIDMMRSRKYNRKEICTFNYSAEVYRYECCSPPPLNFEIICIICHINLHFKLFLSFEKLIWPTCTLQIAICAYGEARFCWILQSKRYHSVRMEG
uniref:uncharacterized protein LOC120335825 isoform X1 n=1 Tax=Styela clava TaxID=7725 RepID=UPI00193A9D4A|nr:uncharacterized protein LOC120335825 isoform X1 [Styela clava]